MVDWGRVHEKIIDVFMEFLRGDEDLIREIETFGRSFRIKDGNWWFGLPDLYEFLSGRDVDVRELRYRRFRRLLYETPINRRLAEHSAEVIVEMSVGNVDQNTYSLGKAVRSKRQEVMT